MNNQHLLRGVSLLAAAAVVTIVAVMTATSNSDANDSGAKAAAVAPLPAPPEQLRLVHAEQFQVGQPYQHLYRADRPQVGSGWLLVLEGRASMLAPKQNLEPVLYVGAQTAERINAGTSGRQVVLVPGDFRLDRAPIFLGPKALPEALDQTRINAALAAAVASGAVAPSAAEIKSAVVAGTNRYATDFELRLRAMDLVEIHSPTETELISGWRAPRVK
jgi:hypothetical protein